MTATSSWPGSRSPSAYPRPAWRWPRSPATATAGSSAPSGRASRSRCRPSPSTRSCRTSDMTRPAVSSLLLVLLVAGCTEEGEAPVAEPPAQTPPSPTEPPASTTPTSPSPSTSPPESTPPPRPVSPDDARVGIALDAVDHLAGRIGPRPGTSAAYFRAADWVRGKFRGSGWEVRRQRFHTPGRLLMGRAGAGRPSVNVIATRGDVRPGSPGCSSARTSTRCRRPPAPRTTRPASASCSPSPRRSPSAAPAAGDAGRVRRRGAARADRRRPPLRLARVRRGPHARPAPFAARDGLHGPGRRRQRLPDRQHRRAVVAAGRAGGRGASGPASTAWPRPGSAPATTGRSCATGCPAYGWAARRTPATTRPATCRR